MLPQTSPALYTEFTTGSNTFIESTTKKSPFPNDDADLDKNGCDIPLDIVQSIVTTRVCDIIFALDAAGLIVHMGTAKVLEDIDGESDDATDTDGQISKSVTAEHGHGHHTMFGSKHYGTD